MQTELGGQPEIKYLPASQVRSQNHHRFAVLHCLPQGAVTVHCHDAFQSLLRSSPEQGDLEGIASTLQKRLPGQMMTLDLAQMGIAEGEIDPGHMSGLARESGQDRTEQGGDGTVHSVGKPGDQSQQ